MRYKKALVIFGLAACLTACGNTPTSNDVIITTETVEIEDSIVQNESITTTVSISEGGVFFYPGDFRPEIKIADKTFYWSELSDKITGTDEVYSQVTAIADGETFLPDTYEEYNIISSTTTSDITDNCQMKASFDATGIIYTSETTPEVIYVLMSTDWFENEYVRFVSSEFINGSHIFLNENVYTISIGNTSSEKELPDGCKSAGTLHFIGQDAIPTNNLETNCPNDTYSYSLEGREVFVDPENNEYIYVYEKQYWAGGDYDACLKCPIYTR